MSQKVSALEESPKHKRSLSPIKKEHIRRSLQQAQHQRVMKNKFISYDKYDKNLVNKYHRPQKVLPRLNVDLCLSPNDSFSEAKKSAKVKKGVVIGRTEDGEALSKD